MTKNTASENTSTVKTVPLFAPTTLKKILLPRIKRGFPLGVAIGYALTIVTSASFGTQEYYPCRAALAAALGGELPAVALQAVLYGVIGSICTAASFAFWVEGWSITKATVIHFLILSLTMLPIAYVLHFMKHTLAGVLGYFVVFVVIYVLIWLATYCNFRAKIRRINKALRKK